MLSAFLTLLILSWCGPGPKHPYVIEKLNHQINTQYDEINPVVSPNGQTIYFTRVGHPSFEKTLKVSDDDFSKTLSFADYKAKLQDIFYQLGEEPDKNPVTSSFNQDIWIAKSKHGSFDELEHPGYPLNSALPNSVCAVTTDPNTLVIMNQFYKDGSMLKGFSFVKRKNKREWDFPEPLYIYDYYNLDAGVNLTLSRDNEVMILSMNRNDSYGQNDLYVSFRVHTTLWSAPIHLGGIVNTDANEITPYISDDKRFLFFSSHRASGVGGQDIFMCERLDDSWTNWSSPIALPEPINSPADDAQPFYNLKGKYLYFTSTRDGSSDIFRVKFDEIRPDPEERVVATPAAPAEKKLRLYVVNATNEEAIDADLSLGIAGDDDNHEKISVSRSGYAMEYPSRGKILSLKVNKKGFLARNMLLDVSKVQAAEDGEHLIKVAIDPLEVDARISMAPIYFMRGKDRILSVSYRELDRLAAILKKHPALHIRINGHTDNVGDDWSLYQLSAQRATAVKRYLVKMGIQSYRIKTRGYGPSQPLTDNSSEEMRSKNRRVEVLITKV